MHLFPILNHVAYSLMWSCSFGVAYQLYDKSVIPSIVQHHCLMQDALFGVFWMLIWDVIFSLVPKNLCLWTFKLILDSYLYFTESDTISGLLFDYSLTKFPISFWCLFCTLSLLTSLFPANWAHHNIVIILLW